MELATAVAMDKAEAAGKAAEYRAAVAQSEDPAYRMIAEGYEALAKGVTLINLPEAIRRGGVDENKRPRLVAGRSDARVVFLEASGREATFAADDVRSRARVNRISVPDFEGLEYVSPYAFVGALVPVVPPEHRPRWFNRPSGRYLHLRNFVTLWEVGEEGWARRSASGRRAPRDPALLRRVSGDLYAVLAVWDLTDLEQMVLEGARRS